MNFSSTTICAATMTCATMMSTLPTMALLSPVAPAPPAQLSLHALTKLLAPTTAVPASTKATPSHLYPACGFFKNTAEKVAVKITTEPRSI